MVSFLIKQNSGALYFILTPWELLFFLSRRRNPPPNLSVKHQVFFLKACTYDRFSMLNKRNAPFLERKESRVSGSTSHEPKGRISAATEKDGGGQKLSSPVNSHHRGSVITGWESGGASGGGAGSQEVNRK